jgi:hypothetical protein
MNLSTSNTGVYMWWVTMTLNFQELIRSRQVCTADYVAKLDLRILLFLSVAVSAARTQRILLIRSEISFRSQRLLNMSD